MYYEVTITLKIGSLITRYILTRCNSQYINQYNQNKNLEN